MFPLILLLLPLIHAAPMMDSHPRGPSPSREDAFYQAAISGNTDEMLRLLAAGVDVNHPDSDGFTPLMGAAYHGLLSIVQLLIQSGARIEDQALDGQTALYVASLNGKDWVSYCRF